MSQVIKSRLFRDIFNSWRDLGLFLRFHALAYKKLASICHYLFSSMLSSIAVMLRVLANVKSVNRKWERGLSLRKHVFHDTSDEIKEGLEIDSIIGEPLGYI